MMATENALDVGRDVYCLDSLRPGRMARGVTLVGQRCYHRLITPRGALRGGDDEANFGLDLAGKCGSTDDTILDSMLPVMVQNELLKDPTVESVKCTASRITDAGQSSWTLSIDVQSSEGPFELIVAASAVSVELLGVK